MEEPTVRTCQCLYPDCGHVWTPRTDGDPKACPACKRYNWMYPGGKKPRVKKGGARNVRKRAKPESAIDTFKRKRDKTTV